MSEQGSRILIVEDEDSIGDSLEENLQQAGYTTARARTGEEAFFLLTTEAYDLALLDWMLPGRSGVDILRTLRARELTIPVLILTARDDVEDRVAGLDAGADDYLLKPFALPELLARVRSLLRRNLKPEQEHRCIMADLELDRLNRMVQRGGEAIDLTPKEFELLEYLFRMRGRIVSREMLGKDVWQVTSRATPLDNVIDVHMARLRKKVDQNYGRRLIHTVRGVGFVLKETA